MPDAIEVGKETEHAGSHVREDSEYVRLVISSEPRIADPDILQSQPQSRDASFIWWTKAIILSFITIILLLIFFKWGVPFLFEKVSIYLLLSDTIPNFL